MHNPNRIQQPIIRAKRPVQPQRVIQTSRHDAFLENRTSVGTESRIEQALVSKSRTATVLGKLFVVRGENDRALDPDPFPHFASSRSTARRFFAMRRTCFICASKRGS